MTAYQEFGNYLRTLREKHKPMITQEKLGELVGKNKMTISQIENGKNAPPQGEFLNKIAENLNLNEEEKIRFFDLAAIARGNVPTDILEYFNKHQELRNAVRRAQKKKLTDADWLKMVK